MSNVVPLNVFSLTSRGCSIAFHHAPLYPKAKGTNFFKQFFVNRKNHLKRFSQLSAGVDKTLKFTIASLELSKLMTQRFEPTSASLPGLSAAYTGLKDARSVLGLFNALQGSIPGMVDSVKLCNRLVHDLRHGEQATSLTNELLMTPAHCQKEKVTPENTYSNIAFGRKQQIAKAVESACGAVGAGTFAFTFAALRPVMLANQYEKFLSPQDISSVGLAADALMCVNHIVGIGSAVSSLVYEMSAFTTAKTAILKKNELRNNHIKSLNVRHRDHLTTSSLTLIEKSLELTCDILKLVPTWAVAVPKEVRAGIGVLIGALGIYKIWKTS